jgi:hypothetical protein
LSLLKGSTFIRPLPTRRRRRRIALFAKVAWDAVREEDERSGRSLQRHSKHSAGDSSSGSDEAVPPLPPPVTFLKAGEAVGLSGPVAKKGPSVLSPFRNRLLVLTGRRVLYFAQRGGPPGVVWLTRDSVCR